MSATTPTLYPPPIETAQQAYTAHSGGGSVGPVIGVIAVIIILGALAVMIGRLCSGRKIMGGVQYDFEGWIETKCASCIDGRVAPPPPQPRMVVEHGSSGEVIRAAPIQGRDEEGREAEVSENHPRQKS